ncbi:P-loop containing nucleoside triphosphate hydrolase protein [Mycena olivaceomarginata]|nr:P-loop containing nucleoside triphosphate hydrolase protein [Mycena olivaceomarginata]
MEGGGTEETQGMIPRAVAQVFRVAEELKDKGVDVYDGGTVLEIIHHHPTHTLTSRLRRPHPALTSPAQVLALLAQAQGRRLVAATLMNERSSRSHSVFTLRSPRRAGRRERGEGVRVGTLNLGGHGGGERLATLGMGSARAWRVAGPGAHVPYRNSKVRLFLRCWIEREADDGNSKTLMVLNLSPLAAHLNESLTSLRFATKKVQVQNGKA